MDHLPGALKFHRFDNLALRGFLARRFDIGVFQSPYGRDRA